MYRYLALEADGLHVGVVLDVDPRHYIHLSTYLSIHLSIHLSIYIYLCIYLSFYLSIYTCEHVVRFYLALETDGVYVGVVLDVDPRHQVRQLVRPARL